MTKEDVIKHLELHRHPTEGGYFRRTYESSLVFEGRKILTSIYYLLSNDQTHGYLHKNKSDIIHYYHLGAPIKYWIISPQGKLSEQILGPNILAGEVPQLIVKGGDWKISQLCSGDFGLISEAVAPGFDYVDNEIASFEMANTLFADLMPQIKQYIKRE